VPEPHESQLRLLRAQYWSHRDPDGRAFAPLAEAYRLRGELDEAYGLIRDGLGRLPDFPTGHLIAARVAKDRNEPVAARAHLDRVLELDGDNPVALMERAELRVREGDLEGALADLGLVLALDPADESVRARVLELEEVRGAEVPPALDPVHQAEPNEGPEPEPIPATSNVPVDLPETHEGEPGAFLVTRTMGDLYARQGLLDRAIEVYEQLLEAAPGDPELSARLAELRTETAGAGWHSTGLPDGVDQSAIPGRGAPPAAAAGTDSAMEDGEVGEVSSAQDVRTIGGYFGDLMAWVPGAVPIATLAPDPLPDSAVASGGSAGLPDASPQEAGVEGSPDFEAWLRGLAS